VGGAATHTTGVINGFLENGLDVRVGAPERPLGTDGADFTPVSPRIRHGVAEWLTSVDYSDAVVASLSGARADLVYQRYALGSFAGLELARKLQVPLVLEFNGSEIWTHRAWRGSNLPLSGLAEALERRNLIDATLVVVVSAALFDEVVAHGVPRERVLVNPNGVDLPRLGPYRERTPASWRAAAGLPEAPTVGFIGTFSPWHGPLVLPPLIDVVAASAPGTRWVLIGDGPLHGEVAAAVERSPHAGDVTLTGLVDRDHALELLAACDVCVSPQVPNPDGSPFFGSPTKLFEYMGLGKAVVASDLGQIGEVIEHERTGLLSPAGEVGPAAEAVVRLLDDPELRARLGNAALAKAQAAYGWHAHVRRTLDALQELGAERRTDAEADDVPATDTP
jgi:glycosyltransferase involved in cell wall biosynthesis